MGGGGEKSWRTWIGGEGKSEGKETSIFFHDASVLHSVGGMMGWEWRERTLG